jgi:hypothetical protein
MTTIRRAAGLLLTALAVASCSSAGADPSPGPNSIAPTVVVPSTESAPPRADDSIVAAVEAQLATSPAACDPLDARQCLLPFPSDALTVADDASPTGRRVAFPADELPTNSAGIGIDPTAWNRNDGFSANSPLLTWIDDLDPEASQLPVWTDLASSMAAGASAVLVDTTSGDRIPLWAEVDVDSTAGAGQLLVVRPAISLAPATTYAVGLRNLVTTAGSPVEPSPMFRVYRDGLATDIAEVEARRDEFESTFDALVASGAVRDDLQFAWSFTTASVANTTDAILHMRDETLAGLGTATPEFEITSVTENPEPGLARLVEGTYSVPNWMTGDGGPGTALNRGAVGLPEINGVVQAPFACEIADSVWKGTGPAHAVMYGHGLLGSHLEVDAGNIVAMSNEHDALYCATKWAGFSEDDIPTAISALQDLTNFQTFVDRMSQGLINQLVLGRLMLADNGLVIEPEFTRPDGSAMLDNSEVYFDGNSQGGIMGMALAAISTDLRRAALGVVGMNYSTLLPRSVDFDEFETILVPAYPDPVDRAIGLAAIQMLWDPAEGAGYVRHLVADPLAGTPPKDVLMHVAFGDWQVSELTAMVAARTMGIPIHRPVSADGRSREIDPGWGLDTLDDADATSALIIWDSGSDPIPIDAVPPSTSRDPHGDPRNDPEARRQKAAFLFDGELIDVCDAAACTAAAR